MQKEFYPSNDLWGWFLFCSPNVGPLVIMCNNIEENKEFFERRINALYHLLSVKVGTSPDITITSFEKKKDETIFLSKCYKFFRYELL